MGLNLGIYSCFSSWGIKCFPCRIYEPRAAIRYLSHSKSPLLFFAILKRLSTLLIDKEFIEKKKKMDRPNCTEIRSSR